MVPSHGGWLIGTYIVVLVVALLWLFSPIGELVVSVLVLAGTMGDIRIGRRMLVSEKTPAASPQPDLSSPTSDRVAAADQAQPRSIIEPLVPEIKQWYGRKGQDTFGPVTEGDLRRFAEQGFLAPTDLIWREGMPEWQESASVLPLKDLT